MRISILKWVWVVILLAGCGPSGPVYPYALTISGAVERDLSNSEVYFEGSGPAQQLYFQKQGPGSDILVLSVWFPAIRKAGTYKVSANGPVKAAYTEAVDEKSRMFTQNPRGTLVVREVGATISGAFTISLDELQGKTKSTITIQGSFEGISYTGQGQATATPTPSPISPDQIPVLTRPLSALLYLIFFALLVGNLAILLYAGRVVYGGWGMALLRLARPTRTFVLGWKDPRLKGLMRTWLLLIVVIALAVCMLVALSSKT